jgi:hypothetical protein
MIVMKHFAILNKVLPKTNDDHRLNLGDSQYHDSLCTLSCLYKKKS